MNSKQKIHKVAIIGAGNIASEFDSPSSKFILSHAHAIKNDPRFHLAAFVDTNKNAAAHAARKWGVRAYTDLTQMMNEEIPDIVVIATPDRSHLALLATLLKSKVRLIVCEKPVVTSQAEIGKLKRLIVHTKIPVIVNFSRRFNPHMWATANDIRKGKYGKLITGSAIYTKGILHNGSHLVDLMRMFFGELKDASMSFRVDDYHEGAPSVGGIATFAQAKRFYLMPANANEYSMFELDLLFTKARIRITNTGREIHMSEIHTDPVYKDFRSLGKERKCITDTEKNMTYLYEHIALVLQKRSKNRSPISEALKTHEACFILLKSLKKPK